MTNGNLTSSGTAGSGGNITLTSRNGTINTDSLDSSGASNGGIISLDGRNGVTADNLTSRGTSGNGGRIDLTSGNGTITTESLDSSGASNGGNITLTSPNGTITTTGNLTSRGTSGNGGNITLTSGNGTIKTESLDSSGASNGGRIDLTSRNGIDTGNLTSSGTSGNGGNITLKTSAASAQITAREINSSGSSGRGGNVALSSPGDIQLTSINTQGTTVGGRVDIDTDSFFRATGTFRSANDFNASISSVGTSRGGSITIRHEGKGVTPFIVGDATTNGTTGAIVSRSPFSLIRPLLALPYTFRQGNIQIISVNPPPNIPGNSNNPPNQPDNVSNLDINPVDLSNSQTQLQPLQSSQSSSSTNVEALQIDDLFSRDFTQYFGQSDVKGITLPEARNTLRQVESATGIKAALIYAVFVPSTITPLPATDQNQARDSSGIAQSSFMRSRNPAESDRLELVLVTAEGNPIRKSLNVTRAEVISMTNQLRRNVTNRRNLRGYLIPAQQMYQWLAAPLEQDLQQQNIKNLVYIMDSGLRSIPLAALHDGKGFIVERYSVGLMPSMSLTNTGYKDVRKLKVLAMGAEDFTEQNPLPAVPTELAIITGRLWPGRLFLDKAFTLENLKKARASEPYGIIHLATHAQFKGGKPGNSYIQLSDGKLRLDQLSQLRLNKPPVELLVLSACRTALGDEDAELGFAGLAVQAGVKSALGSLWYVSDEGTLGLMTQFYEQLKEAPIKAEALRQAQVAMLKGETRLQGGKLVTSRGSFPLPPELVQLKDTDLTHPYYWSSFTMIGNPW
jgi:CHAT domain-containing protein